MPFEYMRLAHALADPSVRPHTSRFFEGHSRAVLDANGWQCTDAKRLESHPVHFGMIARAV